MQLPLLIRQDELMPALYNADEIIEIAGGRLGQGMLDEETGSICTDTRRLVEGSWFLALNGREFDGHDFLGDAYCRGARGCIVEERHNYPIATSSFPLIVVPDTTLALRDLSRNWRRRLAFKIATVVADDRERSARVAARIAEKLALQAPTRLIDVTVEGTTGTLEKLLAEEDVTAIVLNLAADTLEEATLLAYAFSSDVLVFLDHPFDYLRLTTREAEIKATVGEVVRTLDRKLKGVVAGGSAQDLIDTSTFPQGTVYRTAAGQEPGEGSDEDFCVWEATKFFLEPGDATCGGMQFQP